MCDSGTSWAKISALGMIGRKNNSSSEMRFYNQSVSVYGFRVAPEGMFSMFHAPDRRTAPTVVGSKLTLISNPRGRSSIPGKWGEGHLREIVPIQEGRRDGWD